MDTLFCATGVRGLQGIDIWDLGVELTRSLLSISGRFEERIF